MSMKTSPRPSPKLLSIFLLCFSSVAVSETDEGQRLTLDAFIEQVKATHQALKASRNLSEVGAAKTVEADLIYAPNIFASAAQSSDAKPTSNPAAQGDKTLARSYSVGVSKMTEFGLMGKLSYNVNYLNFSGTSPQFMPLSEYYEAKPMVELTQSLWKNGFGSESRATRELLVSSGKITEYSEQFKQRMTLLEAEMTYWRLALAREAVAVQKDSLARATKMRDWSSDRANLQLADRADLLQAEAAVKGRRLELQGALDEERSASRSFNTLRSQTSDQVPEHLARISPDLLAQLQMPARTTPRLDVLAANEASKLAKASLALATEKYRPNVELFGSFALNGREDAMGEAAGSSFETDHPTSVIGVRLNAPLAAESISRQRESAGKEAQAATFNAERKTFEEEREWENLSQTFTEAKARLDLATQIEESQLEKLNHERTRLRNGRTVTFQVLMFEQDYASAALNRIRSQADLLRILAQMKTFGSGT